MWGRVSDLSCTDLKKLYNYILNLGKHKELAILLFGFPEEITNSENESFYLGYYNDQTNEYFKNFKQMNTLKTIKKPVVIYHLIIFAKEFNLFRKNLLLVVLQRKKMILRLG